MGREENEQVESKRWWNILKYSTISNREATFFDFKDSLLIKSPKSMILLGNGQWAMGNPPATGAQ